MVPVSGKKDDLAGAGVGHLGHDGIGRIEHGVTRGRDVLHNHALQHRQVFDRGDVVQPQVVAAADVGHHGDLAAVKPQAFAQHAATRHFKHGGVHVRVHQHVARAFRAAAVAAVGLAAIDVNAVGVGHAGAQTVRGQQVGNQARGGGFAVGAGHRNHRNATVVVRRKELVDHGNAHGAALAVRRRNMHAQAGRGIDLDHAAVLCLQRLQHAFAHHIDAADVQANHLRSRHGARRHGWMHFIGHIGGGAAGAQVGVVAQNDALALGRNRFGAEALRVKPGDGDVIKADFGERRGMAFAAPGVLVDDIDQLVHRVHAVAHHLRRLATGGGHQLVAHYQQAEVAARQEALDQHFAMFGGGAKGDIEVCARRDIDRHALALVAVLRLEHDRQADFQRCGPRVVRVAGGSAMRHGNAGRTQQFFGQVFVLGDGFGHGAGGIDFGGLDAALARAPAKLHHAAFGQAAKGNVARHGGFDNRAGARPHALVFIQVA